MKQGKWKLFLQIFWSFLKIGPATFGGGYAMIPLIEREVVIRRRWVGANDITDLFSLAESIPGAIAINLATFIGHRVAGVRGALAALVGILLPTFIIVLVMSMLFLAIKDHPGVEAAFTGIRASIVALIIYAASRIGKTAIFDKTTFGLMLVALFVLILLPVHPILIIVLGAIAGIGCIKVKERCQVIVKPGSVD